jgi:hypothetical protein
MTASAIALDANGIRAKLYIHRSAMLDNVVTQKGYTNNGREYYDKR